MKNNKIYEYKIEVERLQSELDAKIELIDRIYRESRESMSLEHEHEEGLICEKCEDFFDFLHFKHTSSLAQELKVAKGNLRVMKWLLEEGK